MKRCRLRRRACRSPAPILEATSPCSAARRVVALVSWRRPRDTLRREVLGGLAHPGRRSWSGHDPTMGARLRGRRSSRHGGLGGRSERSPDGGHHGRLPSDPGRRPRRGHRSWPASGQGAPCPPGHGWTPLGSGHRRRGRPGLGGWFCSGRAVRRDKRGSAARRMDDHRRGCTGRDHGRRPRTWPGSGTAPIRLPAPVALGVGQCSWLGRRDAGHLHRRLDRRRDLVLARTGLLGRHDRCPGRRRAGPGHRRLAPLTRRSAGPPVRHRLARLRLTWRRSDVRSG
jgi:hypothetical protein